MKRQPSPTEPIVAVIGDVRGSRRAPDRQALHDTLAATLSAVNDDHEALDPLRITVGDEFQGTYATLGAAVEAVYAVHLSLPTRIEVRFGIGRGRAQTLDAANGIHDGSAFWHARAAIEAVKAGESRNPRTLRVGFSDPDGDPALEAAVNAALTGLDQMLFTMDERDQSILIGLLEGRTQTQIAEAEGVSASAISQRKRASGLPATLAIMTALRTLA